MAARAALISIINFYKANINIIRNDKILSKKWFKSMTKLSVALLFIAMIMKKGNKMYQKRRIRTSPFQPKIIIIGAGFSGICAAIRLKTKLNYHNFVILERDDSVGGTWYQNDYPGCCCDVPGINYSLSFEQVKSWTPGYYPLREQTLKYIQDLCKKYDLYQHIQLNSFVKAMKYDQNKKIWNVIVERTQNQSHSNPIRETLTANIVVSGVGILSNKRIPKFKNIDKYKGVQFHSSEWNHSYDITDKKVGVIGVGPTGVQVIPALGALKLDKLYVFARSFAHLMPKLVPAVQNRKKWETLFHLIPGLQRFMRCFFFEALFEGAFYPVIKANSKQSKEFEAMTGEYRNNSLKEYPNILNKVTPNAKPLNKRGLLGHGLFDTFKQSNCELIADTIDEFTENGIQTVDTYGNKRVTELDCIVYCTGFRAQEFLCSIDEGVIGKNGINLQKDVWRGNDCSAYLGITVSDFPNLFMLYGPGCNLAHNSVLFMIECAVEYTVQCVEKMIKNGWSEMDIKQEVMDEFVRKLDEENKKNAWMQNLNITTWYINDKGRGSTNWAWSCNWYWWLTRKVDWKQFNIVKYS